MQTAALRFNPEQIAYISRGRNQMACSSCALGFILSYLEKPAKGLIFSNKGYSSQHRFLSFFIIRPFAPR